jgi:hypothetical protein
MLKCNTNFINKQMSTFSNLEQHNLKTPQNNLFLINNVRRSVFSRVSQEVFSSFNQNVLSSDFLSINLKFKISQAICVYFVLYENKTS